jgi:hypothetical protein
VRDALKRGGLDIVPRRVLDSLVKLLREERDECRRQDGALCYVAADQYGTLTEHEVRLLGDFLRHRPTDEDGALLMLIRRKQEE